MKHIVLKCDSFFINGYIRWTDDIDSEITTEIVPLTETKSELKFKTGNRVFNKVTRKWVNIIEFDTETGLYIVRYDDGIQGRSLENELCETQPSFNEIKEMVKDAEEREVNGVCQECVFAVNDNNPHCGLRGFRTSFNVERCSAENDIVPNGYELQEDGYFSWVKNKWEYPKTYEECCKVLGVNSENFLSIRNVHRYDGEEETIKYERDLLDKFDYLWQLLICRNAYWKIAGEEMGLRKPWEPSQYEMVYTIYRHSNKIETEMFLGKSVTFEFPTPEMRDAFKENFYPDIEICKELL